MTLASRELQYCGLIFFFFNILPSARRENINILSRSCTVRPTSIDFFVNRSSNDIKFRSENFIVRGVIILEFDVSGPNIGRSSFAPRIIRITASITGRGFGLNISLVGKHVEYPLFRNFLSNLPAIATIYIFFQYDNLCFFNYTCSNISN